MKRRSCSFIAWALLVGALAASAVGQTSIQISCFDNAVLESPADEYVRRETMTDSLTRREVPSIGNIFRGTEVGLGEVTFPSSPTNLIVSHGGPWAGGAEVLLDGVQDGIFIGYFEWTETGEFNMFRTDTLAFDPVLATIDLSGPHTIWLIFSGGGPIGEGCGNYEFFTFVFDQSIEESGRPLRGRADLTRRSEGTTVRALTGGNAFQLNPLQTGTRVYSVTGRHLTGSHVPNLSLGSLIGKGMLITAHQQ